MLKKTICALVLIAVPAVVFAASVHFGGDYFLKGSERAADDLYVLTPTAALAGEILGDAVLVARTVESGGAIAADALLVGERIVLGGTVGDDARLIGAELLVPGSVSDDLVAVGPRVVLNSSAVVGGNVYAVGEWVTLAGKVSGSVRSFARETVLDGAILGDVEVWGRITLGEHARIGGNLIYHAPREIAAPRERIGGEIVFVPTREGSIALSGLSGLSSGLFSLQILMTLAFGFVLLFFARERTEEIMLGVTAQFWPRALRGVLIAVLLPLFSALLFASVVGALLGIVVAALFLAALLIASALAGILVGVFLERILFKRAPFPLSYRPVLLGTLVIAALSVIPYIGLLIHALLLVAALGGVGTVFYKHLKELT